MSLYPSLEDMKVDHMAQAQNAHAQASATAAAYAITAPPAYTPAAAHSNLAEYPADQSALYPSLMDYMGMEITPAAVEQHMQVMQSQGTDVAVRNTSAGQMQIAPLTGDSTGLRRAEIRQGVREILLCKNEKGKIGLRVKAINKGIFVAFVHKDSAAALAGLRFGDQILQIDGNNTAGWDTDKCMSVLKKCKEDKITMAIRDRPFERTITTQKDSTGHIGFVFKDGKITAIVKDSSAARNGVLTEHHLVEINGQNVVGMKNKGIGEIIDSAGQSVTITIIPSFVYDHIIKSMGSGLMKKFMDHSIPDM